jgi:NADP-dependent 3-hydroxy acid dehydrogenase YdfG
MINAVLPFMRQQKRGHIINVSSLSGLSAIPLLGIYSASKYARSRRHRARRTLDDILQPWDDHTKPPP